MLSYYTNTCPLLKDYEVITAETYGENRDIISKKLNKIFKNKFKVYT
jgi:hypothetical protein